MIERIFKYSVTRIENIFKSSLLSQLEDFRCQIIIFFFIALFTNDKSLVGSKSHHETVFICFHRNRNAFMIKKCSDMKNNNKRAMSLVAELFLPKAFIQSSCQISKTFFTLNFEYFLQPFHYISHRAFTSSEQCFECSRRCASSRTLRLF